MGDDGEWGAAAAGFADGLQLEERRPWNQLVAFDAGEQAHEPFGEVESGGCGRRG